LPNSRYNFSSVQPLELASCRRWRSCGCIFYEESGWYDGQTWTKPAEVLQRDRLIVTYEIQPLLVRLKRTFGFLALLLLSSVAVWYLL
jgi:hypothetical protein